MLVTPLLAQNALFFGQNIVSGPSVPTFVKSCFGGNSGVATVTCTFSGSVTAGDVIPVNVQWVDATATYTSVTKTSGTSTCGSWTQVGTTSTSGSNHAAQAWGTCSVGGTLTLTFTVSNATAGAIRIFGNDVTGVATTSPVDGNAINVQAAPGTGSNAVTSGNITTTTNGDYIYGWVFDTGGNAAYTAGTGYTIRNTSSVNNPTEDQVQTTAGTIAATFTATSGGGDTMLTGIMALKHK